MLQFERQTPEFDIKLLVLEKKKQPLVCETFGESQFLPYPLIFTLNLKNVHSRKLQVLSQFSQGQVEGEVSWPTQNAACIFITITLEEMAPPAFSLTLTKEKLYT